MDEGKWTGRDLHPEAAEPAGLCMAGAVCRQWCCSVVRDGCCCGARGHLGLREVQGAAHGAESSCLRPGSSAWGHGLAGSLLEACKVMCNVWNPQVYRLSADSQAWRRTVGM